MSQHGPRPVTEAARISSLRSLTRRCVADVVCGPVRPLLGGVQRACRPHVAARLFTTDTVPQRATAFNHFPF